MKKVLAFVMMSLSFFCMHVHAATEETYSVPLSQEDYDDDEFKDLYPKHRRSSPIMATCILDFSNQQILTSVSESILSYEIWSEDGTAQIAAFDNDADVIIFLNGIVGTYQIRIFTDEHIYIGYIEL